MQDVLAKRYAQALFSIGLEDGFYKGYGEELKDFWESLEDSGPAGDVLSSLAYPKELRNRAVDAVIAAAKLAPMVQNFLRLLHEKGRFNLLGSVAAAYQGLVDRKEGLIRGTLTAASTVDESQLAALKSALSTFIGQSVELSVKEDPGLIGGVVAKLGDLVVDGSLKTKLARMSRLLGTA
ncbi:MAG: ATP synthase F1 subunit delta [Deltaproteobacteria bacterium]|jgi:F-type H+-transporting ATPase subunit delta|nr:ATP synthase F1 subunit delta [Deltaproteobacteria bacterium]